MKDLKPYPIEMETAKLQFLQEMAEQHGLPDAGKAVRCLINYARDHPERHGEIFDEIRCNDC